MRRPCAPTLTQCVSTAPKDGIVVVAAADELPFGKAEGVQESGVIVVLSCVGTVIGIDSLLEEATVVVPLVTVAKLLLENMENVDGTVIFAVT